MPRESRSCSYYNSGNGKMDRPPTASLSIKAIERWNRNRKIYHANKGEDEKEDSEEDDDEDEDEGLKEGKDGEEEDAKAEEKKRISRKRKNAPSKEEVLKHIKHLVRCHRKEEKKSNRSKYNLICSGKNGILLNSSGGISKKKNKRVNKRTDR